MLKLKHRNIDKQKLTGKNYSEKSYLVKNSHEDVAPHLHSICRYNNICKRYLYTYEGKSLYFVYIFRTACYFLTKL